MDPVAETINNVERIKFTIALDVPGTDKIGLVNVVDIERLGKIEVFNTLGNIPSFF